MWWLFSIIHILLQYWRNVRLDGFSSNHHKISFQEQQNTQTQSAQIHYVFNGIWGSFENFCKTVNQPHEHATCIQTVSSWAFVHSISIPLSLSVWVFTSCTLASFFFHRLLCHSCSFAVQLHSETNDIAANFAHSPPKISRSTKHKFENIIYSFIFWGLWNGVVFAAIARNSYAKKLDENNLLRFR